MVSSVMSKQSNFKQCNGKYCNSKKLKQQSKRFSQVEAHAASHHAVATMTRASLEQDEEPMAVSKRRKIRQDQEMEAAPSWQEEDLGSRSKKQGKGLDKHPDNDQYSQLAKPKHWH